MARPAQGEEFSIGIFAVVRLLLDVAEGAGPVRRPLIDSDWMFNADSNAGCNGRSR